MNTNASRITWIILVLGIVLVGGGYPLAKSYLGFEAIIRSEPQTLATSEGLTQTVALNRIRARAQHSGCAAVGSSLDELLAVNIASVNAQLESVDPWTQDTVRNVLNWVARVRSQQSPKAAGLPVSRSEREVAAQTLATASPGE
jgi:hypothetical protein